MEDRILATGCPVVILILISFPFTSLPGYCVAMTVLELKVDRLSEFLNATSIPHILTRMLPPDTGSHLSRILWRTLLATGCPVVILILISFSFHKHSRLGGIFLSSNRSLFSSQIAAPNLHASIKPPINKGNQYLFPNLT